jgi:multidrug efflux pump subunit AcrB
LASLVLPRRVEEHEPILMRVIKFFYVPALRVAMRAKSLVIAVAVVLMFIAFGLIAPNLGSEFVPRLQEGAIAVSVVRLTGTDLADSIQYNTQMEKTILRHFPDEVEHVWSRIGTAEIATDPMGIELTDMFITLKPRDQWKLAHTQADLTELIEQHCTVQDQLTRVREAVSAATLRNLLEQADEEAPRRIAEAMRHAAAKATHGIKLSAPPSLNLAETVAWYKQNEGWWRPIKDQDAEFRKNFLLTKAEVGIAYRSDLTIRDLLGDRGGFLGVHHWVHQC